MKGVTLISDLFLLITSLALTVLMISFIWALIVIHGVEGSLGITSPRNVGYKVMFNPINYDTTLLAFLELNNNGITMKKLINAVVVQNNTIVWLDGRFIDAKTVSENYLSSFIDRPYLLKTRNPEIDIAESGTLLGTFQKVSMKLFTLNGEDVDLELYVG